MNGKNLQTVIAKVDIHLKTNYFSKLIAKLLQFGCIYPVHKKSLNFLTEIAIVLCKIIVLANC